MLDIPQSTPQAPVAIVRAAPILAAVLPKCGATNEDGEIVVCGRRDNEQFRLRPLPQLATAPNFLYKPHVVKIGPLRVGLLGGAVGIAMDF